MDKQSDFLEIIAGIVFFSIFTLLFNIFYNDILFLSPAFDPIRPIYNLSLTSGIFLSALTLFIKSSRYKLFVEFTETFFFVVLGIIFWVVFPFDTSVIGNTDLWNAIFRILIVVPPALSLLEFLTKVIMSNKVVS